MADPELVERLRQGSVAWNMWRFRQPPGRAFDLRGADLSGANLSRAKLFNTDLSHATLNSAKLSRATGNRGNTSKQSHSFSEHWQSRSGTWELNTVRQQAH